MAPFGDMPNGLAWQLAPEAILGGTLKSLGFRIQVLGSGFRVEDFRVLGFQGLGLGVLWFGVSSLGLGLGALAFLSQAYPIAWPCSIGLGFRV